MSCKKTKSRDRNPLKQYGFLKPTISSQRRCLAPAGTAKLSCKCRKKRLPKMPEVLNDTNNFPSKSISMPSSSAGLQSAVQMYATDFSPDNRVKHNDAAVQMANNKSLDEAKKMCEELKEQINALKLHQEMYEQRMNSQIGQTSQNLITPTHAGRPSAKSDVNTFQDENTKQSYPGEFINANGNPFIKVNVTSKSRPLKESGNLPEMSYGDLLNQSGDSESIIKKLHLERDKYKRKVLKLQTELKMMKKSKKLPLKFPEIPPQELSFFTPDMIGEGRLTVVYEGTLYDKPVAVKKLSRLGMMTSSDRSYLAAEAGLLLPLQHRNVVRVVGVCSTSLEPLIVTELVNGKTVLDLIIKSGGGLDAASFFSIARDTAIGMAYLHSQKPPVLHLNLRPSNVLVDPLMHAKVADFGFSKIRIDAGITNYNNLAYFAPELTKLPVKITTKTDVYAFAVLMWQMTTGRDPAAGRTTSQILDMMEQNQRLRIRSDLPNSIQCLISSCWDTSTIHRPSFKEIILEFETMNLPREWLLKLREIGISRVDTSDLASTNCDNNSVASLASTSASSRGSCKFDQPQKTTIRSTKSMTSKQTCADHSKNLPQANVQSKDDGSYLIKLRRGHSAGDAGAITATRDSVGSHDEVRYVVHDLPHQISTPDVIHTKKSTPCSAIDDFHHPVPQYHGPNKANAENLTNCSPEISYPIDNSMKPNLNAKGDPSFRFDSRFRDFVNDACQRESTSKINIAAYPKWPDMRQNARDLKKKSLLSSENIQVRSLSTPSCSTLASSKRSSIDTAVYVPPYEYQSLGIGYDQPISDGVKFSSYDENPSRGIAEERLRSDFRSGKILNNAKHLLSTSPFRNAQLSSSNMRYRPTTSDFSSSNAVKPLPEYIPKHLRQVQRFGSSERGGVPSESSKSDVSAESYLPLPPKLQPYHHNVFPVHYTAGRANASEPLRVKIVPGPNKATDPRHDPTDDETVSRSYNGRCDVTLPRNEDHSEVAKILSNTAEKLESASDVLYTATEQLKKGSKSKTYGSV